MYEIERKEDRIIIRRQGQAVYSTVGSAFILYQTETGVKVSKVNELSDEKLLLALANAIPLQVDSFSK